MALAGFLLPSAKSGSSPISRVDHDPALARLRVREASRPRSFACTRRTCGRSPPAAGSPGRALPCGLYCWQASIALSTVCLGDAAARVELELDALARLRIGHVEAVLPQALGELHAHLVPAEAGRCRCWSRPVVGWAPVPRPPGCRPRPRHSRSGSGREASAATRGQGRAVASRRLLGRGPRRSRPMRQVKRRRFPGVSVGVITREETAASGIMACGRRDRQAAACGCWWSRTNRCSPAAIAEWLRDEAHAVDVAYDGGAALERLERQRVRRPGAGP